MLRIIEYGLLAVSLLVVIGLIVSGSRCGSEGTGTPTGGLDEGPEAHEPGKTL
jgi:hypothetical protein